MTSIPLLLLEEDVEGGGKSDSSNDIENDFAYRNNVQNADIKIRMAFLRKVYSLISLQLLLTIVVSAVFILVDPIKTFVQQNTWMSIISFVITAAILVALHFKRHEHPTNLILLGAFTLMQAYVIGAVVTLFDVSLVIEAMSITMAIVIGLTIYTYQSKRDFSFLGFGLFAGLAALFIGGIIQLYVQSSAMELLFGIGGGLLFALFIIHDTYMLMQVLSPEEYIIGAINIYVDIVNLFLHILQALVAANR